MQTLTINDTNALLSITDAPCVSLFMPTHRAHPAKGQDPIRYRNLLKQVEDQIEAQMDESASNVFLRPLRQLDDEAFWRHQTGGLAVYRSPELAGIYQVPDELPELAVVSDRFHVKPLLPSLQGNHTYYVLQLSQNEVALYRGSATGLTRVEPTPIPSSIQDALGPEVHIRHLDHHPVRKGGRQMAHHGHGGPGEAKKDETKRFLRAVANGLWSLLHTERAPLIVVGVEAYQPLFRELCRYPHIVEAGVVGNYAHANQDELHRLTWPRIEPILRKREDAAIAEVRQGLSTGHAVDDLPHIAQAAVGGRVRTLLLAQNEQLWGDLEESGRVVVHDERQPGSRELLELLARLVLQRRGDVFVLPQERMPTQLHWAAALRW